MQRMSQNQYNKLRKWEETIEEDLEIEKENWKKMKKKRRKENGGNLLHLSSCHVRTPCVLTYWSVEAHLY